MQSMKSAAMSTGRIGEELDLDRVRASHVVTTLAARGRGVILMGLHLVASISRQFAAASRMWVVTTAAGSPDFLGRSNHQNDSGPPAVRINRYVIVELSFAAVRFAKEAVAVINP